jgi:UDP-glucose 4-epimerase
VVPTQAGFDPRLQFVHTDDATGALAAAVHTPVPGPVNVAPSASVSLHKILRMAGRPNVPIPHPLFAPLLSRLGQRLGLADLYSDAVQLLRYGRGLDNARLRLEVGYQPAFDAVGAARDFARAEPGASARPEAGRQAAVEAPLA